MFKMFKLSEYSAHLFAVFMVQHLLTQVWQPSSSLTAGLRKRNWGPAKPSFNVTTLGTVFSDHWAPIARDGGASGRVGKYNVMFFSDSFGDMNEEESYFISNTLTYYGHNDPQDPLNHRDFGLFGRPGEPLLNSEADEEVKIGDRVALWPTSNMLAVNDTHLTGFASMVTNVTNTGGNYVGLTQYTVFPTVFGPVTDRVVDRLFEADEIGYGGFGNLKLDGYIYLFAGGGHNVEGGIKMARMRDDGFVVDKQELTYWDGKTWASSPPTANDKSANMINFEGLFSGPYTGDIFYDKYHKSLACVFMESGGGVFELTYPSDPNDLTSPWSEPIRIAQFDPSEGNWLSYGGHAHPDWENDGEGSLLLSYNDGEADRKMVRVDFTDPGFAPAQST